MTEGRAGSWPDGDGSERYAETGGWPPPAPDQRRYGPGTTPAGPPGHAGTPDPDAGMPDPYARRGPDPAAPWAPGDAWYGRLPGATPTPPRPAPRRAPVGRAGTTPVTLGLVAVNVLVYLLQVVDPTLTYRYGLLPLAVDAGQYERLVTSAFLHGSLLHLASNMLALYIVGAPLERVLGTARFLTIYLASALGGSLLAMLLSPPDTLGVGASGAVFGLFGALVVLRNRVGADARGVAMLIGLNLVISFAVPGISWQAHVGGLLTGIVVALLLGGWRRRPG
ncbi:MAG: rhomboid family intramembrane serine protease [Mycobacteriales bacterium]